MDDMGIPLNGSTSVFCDNESVVKNSSSKQSHYKGVSSRSFFKMLELFTCAWKNVP
jgi:hypothetical protein